MTPLLEFIVVGAIVLGAVIGAGLFCAEVYQFWIEREDLD